MVNRNIFIEGDNIHALENLQGDYIEKIKMIYIDPPYNTGNAQLYGDKMTHQEWADMIRPRLELAKNLLRPDGAIFISIDDHEQHNLRLICNEIFGERNFIAQYVWKRKITPLFKIKHVATVHEYVLAYAKHKPSLPPFNLPFDPKNNKVNDYVFEDGHIEERGRYRLENLKRISIKTRDNLIYPIEAPDGTAILPNLCHAHGRWVVAEPVFLAAKAEGRIVFKKTKESWGVFYKTYEKLDYKGAPRIAKLTTWLNVPSNSAGTRQVASILGNARIFPYAKHTKLIEHFLRCMTSGDDIVLDFFAGSCTTAHAVMALNAQDGGSRKFIMVQIAEPLPLDSEAYKSGYKTIADLGRERIRRVAKALKEKHPSMDFDCDFL